MRNHDYDSVIFNSRVVGLPIDRHPELIPAFRNNELVFSNGVWRWGKGTKYPGAIAAHAKEVLSLTSDPMHLAASRIALNSQLSTLIGITSVGAAASVLTLGVSVVGFGLVLRRLGAIQRSIHVLSQSIDRGVASLQSAIQALDSRIVGAAAVIRGDIGGIKEDVARLVRDFQAREFSSLEGIGNLLQRQQGRLMRDVRKDLQHAERITSDMLPWLKDHVHQSCGATDDRAAVEQVVFSQAYAAAVVFECAALFHLRSPIEAATTLRQRVDAVHVDWARASSRAIPFITMREESRERMRHLLGRSVIENIAALQSKTLPPAGVSSFELAAPTADQRMFLAATYAMCAGRLIGLAEELEEGDPMITDPLARWESPDPQIESKVLVYNAA